MKIIMLYPPDAATEEVHNLHLLYFRVLERLQPEHEVLVVGRITEEQFRRTCPTTLRYYNFFDHFEFDEDRHVTPRTTPEAELGCGMPFSHMRHCCQRRWGWYDGLDNDRLARYVYAWSAIFTAFPADVLIPSFDNLYFVYTAIGIASAIDIRVVKFIRGRLINDSVMFWDENNRPISYKDDSDGGETYRRFIDRSSGKATVLKDSKAFSNLSGGIRSIPRKMLLATAGGFDLDIPAIIPKYRRLLMMALRTRLYPPLHRMLSCRKPDNGHRYFLFPLHFEWEANLTYREPFADQIQLARQIANMLPINTMLYVKLHPHWKGCDIDLLPLWRLSRLENVRIILPEANTVELIGNSLGVIVLNGTVGYEALSAGKPVIVLGHENYGAMAEYICNLAELPQLLVKMVSGKAVYSAGTSKRFLKAYASLITPIDDLDRLVEETRKVLMSPR